MFGVINRLLILVHPMGGKSLYTEYILVVFVVPKRSNALFKRMACSEILLELCPAEANVLSDAGTIRNVNIEMYLLSGF
jgi:hypothetical protein